MSSQNTGPNITVTTLMRMKQQGERIAVLTSYDSSFTKLLERAGIEVLLVGDSLGMVIQGQESTLPVKVSDMVYHVSCVARARQRTLLVADMPFMSYSSVRQAIKTAGRLMKAGAHMVKLEGGATQVETVNHLTTHGIPVCAHLGLTPQSVHQLGGYKVQGRNQEAARIMAKEAQELQQAGAQMMVLECVPAALAEETSQALDIPVIGIGAGSGCDGQVLVLHDLLGITLDFMPRFCRNFLHGENSIQEAVENYVAAVKEGSFPSVEESFQ